jgi:hypothetical protein
MTLRDAGELLAPAVNDTVAALTLAPEDAAAVKLAQRYAAAIDDGGDLEKLGPKLLAALESLGATPAARARLKEGSAGGKPAGLRALRQAHGA